MAKYPSEIFGCYLRNVSPEAEEMRRKFWCPFHESPCYKQSRLIDYPFGVCTAHVGGQEIALCPRRFLENNTVFSLYDLKENGIHLELVPTRMFSSTVDALFDAFRRNDDIPPVEKFVERLESKLSGDMKIALHLSRNKAPVKFDAPKPGATGRVRELSNEFSD
ncbi:MAG: hypothetical protein K0B01_05225 [Syntrophobacterales bacterium]|nr:hypothetical protein [Syntrophobacterales bacterium]